MNYPQSLYNFAKNKNEIFAKIVDPNLLSPEKFIFNKDYKLNIKRIVDVIHEDQKTKKQIKSFKDFSNSTYVSLKSFDLKDQYNFPIYYPLPFYVDIVKLKL